MISNRARACVRERVLWVGALFTIWANVPLLNVRIKSRATNEFFMKAKLIGVRAIIFCFILFFISAVCVCVWVYVLYICSSLQRDMNTLVSAKHACEHWIRIFSRISVYAELFFMYAYFALVSTLYDIGCETRCRSFVRCCFGSVQNIWHTSEERTQKPTHHHHHHSYPFTPKWNK